MFFRYYKGPISIFIVALIIYLVFGVFIPSIFGEVGILNNLIPTSEDIAFFGALFFCIISIIWFVSDSYTYWKYENDRYNGVICRSCSGITSYHVDEKYGATYYQCRFCGNKNH